VVDEEELALVVAELLLESEGAFEDLLGGSRRSAAWRP
jgi:hypothetical protein